MMLTGAGDPGENGDEGDPSGTSAGHDGTFLISVPGRGTVTVGRRGARVRRADAGPSGAAPLDPSAEDHRAIVVVLVGRVRSRSTTTGTWSLGSSPLRSLRWICAPATASANAWRAEDEVDAHALVLREAQSLVVPVRVAGRHERPHDIGQARRLERGERLALERRDVGREARDHGGVAVVGIRRGDVEVADQREREVGVRRQRVARVLLQRARASRACSSSAGRRARARWARRGSRPGRRRRSRRSRGPPAGHPARVAPSRSRASRERRSRTSVSGSRLAIATPFHCEKPCASTW